MRLQGKTIRVLAGTLAALGLAVLPSACGSGDSDSAVTLTIGSRGTPEERVLGNVYAEALKDVGYEVKGRFGIETEYEEAPLEELKRGRISAYPEPLDTLVRLLRPEIEVPPTDLRQAYKLVRDRLRAHGLTALPPAPYSRNVRIALLSRTADRYGLKTVSDLKGKTAKMAVSGPGGCHPSPHCLGGLERTYGILFGRGFIYQEAYAGNYNELKTDILTALETGEVDAAFVVNTEGRLSSGKFALLDYDKPILPAGNPVLVTSKDVVEEAGEDFEKTVVAVQRGLTVRVVQRLVAEVELEGKDPEAVADHYISRLQLPS
jgi:osmoprotectant transport system substrate-binding protein